MTKLASALPQGGNGLDAISHKLVSKPHDKHVIIGVIDCSKVTTDHDNGSVEPTARVRRLELIEENDLEFAEQLIRRGLDRRLGATTLPLAIEDDITEAFQSIGEDDLHAGIDPADQPDDDERTSLRTELLDAQTALRDAGRTKYARARRLLQLLTQDIDRRG